MIKQRTNASEQDKRNKHNGKRTREDTRSTQAETPYFKYLGVPLKNKTRSCNIYAKKMKDKKECINKNNNLKRQE